MMPKKRKRSKLTIAEARTVLQQEEAQRLIDPDAVALWLWIACRTRASCFSMKSTKSPAPAARRGPNVSREGVQRDLLPIVEGSSVNTKYGVVRTDHILFIASGAFHVSKPSDLIPELQGRFPIRSNSTV